MSGLLTQCNFPVFNEFCELIEKESEDSLKGFLYLSVFANQFDLTSFWSGLHAIYRREEVTKWWMISVEAFLKEVKLKAAIFVAVA